MRREPLVNITVPVLNEESTLRGSISRLAAFLRAHPDHHYEITLADNGSTDRTWRIAETLRCEYGVITVIHLEHAGRGRALKQAWQASQADVLTYMDADLSTDLIVFPKFVGSLATGEYDIALGTRLLDKSSTKRRLKREIISRCYNLLVRTIFRTRITDFQCGFKGITKETARELLPLVEDNGWFMDTELLLLAEDRGYRIAQIPVRWTERRDSRVKILPTIIADLKGLIRLRRTLCHERSSGIPARTEEMRAA
jgi:glycosyltransferase involved in cell wall biosynthesis